MARREVSRLLISTMKLGTAQSYNIVSTPRLENGTIENHPIIYVAVKIAMDTPGDETITGKARREHLWVWSLLLLHNLAMEDYEARPSNSSFATRCSHRLLLTFAVSIAVRIEAS
jgi:hypothetical protein